MRILVRALAFILGAWISQKYAAGFWVVGPVFGLTVLVWRSHVLGDLFELRHLLYMAASTVIYACVFWIAKRDFGYNTGFWEIFTGSVSWGVLFGSVTLVWVHRLVLGPKDRHLGPMIAQLAGSFYFISALSKITDHFEIGTGRSFIPFAVFIWQGIYLANFFLIPDRDNSGGRLRLKFD